jgi:uncharacterized protein with NAD-binding domain and iron-sulfur cluster
MQWVFDKHALFGGESSHLSLVSSAAVVRRAVVVREKRATFSVAPGQPRRPATRTAVPGLFLAGDWIDTGLPATIESAVVSGHRAAAEALEFLRSGSSLTPLE